MSSVLVRKKRDQLYKKQHGKCFWCRKQMAKKQGELNSITLDHYPIPRSKGGTIAWGNVIAACFACNTNRGDGTNGKGKT